MSESDNNINIKPPIYFNCIPSNMSSTFNKTPEIYISLKKEEAYIGLSKGKLFIDDKEIIPQVQKYSMSYISLLELSYGEHHVKVLLWDIDDTFYEYDWCFFIENPNTQYNFYYGVPHAHTSYSDGIGTPTEAYEYARNNDLNFLIITDHLGRLIKSELFDDKKSLYEGKLYSNWEMLNIEADKINKKYSDFLALTGFEAKIKDYGDMNVISNINIPDKRRMTLKELYDWLCTDNAVIVSINHPRRNNETIPYSNKMNNFIKLMEVGNGSPPHKYRRSLDCYFDALANGWYIGAINGQDNHIANWGTPNNLTVVIADSLNVYSILNALKRRRVYSTESRTLKLTVSANNHCMGSILDLGKNDLLNLRIIAEDEVNSISKIEIISNSEDHPKEKLFENSYKAEWNLSLSVSTKSSWYVVKVIHTNKLIGLSSPIFTREIFIPANTSKY